MTVGVTIGKFNPFHLGHDHLIRVAKSQVDRLVVIVAERSDQTIPGHRRADWISSTHPDVEVLVTPDDLPELGASAPAGQTHDVDDLLDEIDGVLESNAEEFVKGFVQKGGQ